MALHMYNVLVSQDRGKIISISLATTFVYSKYQTALLEYPIEYLILGALLEIVNFGLLTSISPYIVRTSGRIIREYFNVKQV